MLLKAIIVWVAGLVTIVPYGTYYLFFHAQREQYAFLIVGVLFWVFGYWGVVGPLITLSKVRSVFRGLAQAHAEGRLPQALQSAEARDLAIDFIIRENAVPRFIAERVYQMVVQKLLSASAAGAGHGGGSRS